MVGRFQALPLPSLRWKPEDGAANSEDRNVDASPGLQDETGAPFADEEKNWYFHGKLVRFGSPDMVLTSSGQQEA